MNTAVAMSRVPDSSVLLSDFDLNSGMVRFMLKLDSAYCVTDAAEHALEMDESLWPTMVTTIDKLDVLHAGKLNPDFRIEPTQIRHLMEFMRRNYSALCFDMSGNLERYSLEIMHESKRIFPGMHAGDSFAAPGAREVSLPEAAGFGRARQRAAEPLPEAVPDLAAADRATAGRSDLHDLPERLSGRAARHDGGPVGGYQQRTRPPIYVAGAEHAGSQAAPVPEPKKRFIEFFSVVPGKAVDAGQEDGGLNSSSLDFISRPKPAKAARHAFF
jgi:hypothetical protein